MLAMKRITLSGPWETLACTTTPDFLHGINVLRKIITPSKKRIGLSRGDQILFPVLLPF